MLVQSSSVTTGVAIVAVSQGILLPTFAISIVMGANIGTTSTALIAAWGGTPAAKKTAMANLLVNFSGVILFLPWLQSFSSYVILRSDSLEASVAWAHLIFNLSTSLIFLVLLYVWKYKAKKLKGKA